MRHGRAVGALLLVAATLLAVSPAAAITTTTNPDNYIGSPPSFFDGVARLRIETTLGIFGCSGSLLGTGRHVLTAAHCVTDDTGALIATDFEATFFLAGGPQTIEGVGYSVNPCWTGSLLAGCDLAIVELASLVPTAGYDLFLDASVLGGVIGVLAGYGMSGTGFTGEVLDFGTLRAGLNRMDTVWLIPGLPFAYDFDNGTTIRDAIGFLIPSLADVGLGIFEVFPAAGDSGGPTFVGGLLAGVHSFRVRIPILDIDGELNSSFGELGGDTRVAAYQAWVDSVIGVPEPASLVLLGSGLLVLAVLVALRARRR